MKLKTEAHTTYNALDHPDWLNPKGRVAKSMEMSIRRAAALDKLCSYSDAWVPPRPANRTLEKLAEEATGQKQYWRHPIWREDTWRWVYLHWRNGGLRRSITALSQMLPKQNAARVEQLVLGD